jgi:uracil phosphoribosyltransferase
VANARSDADDNESTVEFMTGHAASRIHQVSTSPLATAWLGDMRDPDCPRATFRRRARQLTRLLAHHAADHLEWTASEVTTALGEVATSARLHRSPVVVPPVRAGLGMLDGALDVFEDALVAPVGLARDEQTLQPRWYLDVNGRLDATTALICDPMLATGGTTSAVGTRLVDHGVTKVVVLALVAAPEGLRRVIDEHPSWSVHVAAIDRALDDRGFILPGLGDAGDRWCGMGDALK